MELVHGRLLYSEARAMTETQRLYECWLECHQQEAGDAAWEVFFNLARPLFVRLARRVTSTWQLDAHSNVEDLVQDVCLKLMEKRSGFAAKLELSPHLFEAYLRSFAANAIQDSFRFRFAQKRNEKRTVCLEERWESLASDIGLRGVERAVFFDQIKGLLQARDIELAVFHLYYEQGYSAKEIAACPGCGLNVKGVESLLHRLRKQIIVRLESKGESQQMRGGARGGGHERS